MNRIERVSALLRDSLANPRRLRVGQAVLGFAIFGLAAIGVAGLLLAAAATPAGAKTQAGVQFSVTVPAQGAGASFAFGPVKLKVQAPARPRFAVSIGHYTVGQPYARPRQILAYNAPLYDAPAYGCPPYGAPIYGQAGYGVPLYDYRADRLARRGQVPGYGRKALGYGSAAAQRPTEDAPGMFNLPSRYVTVGLTETPRPRFEPRIVQLAGAAPRSGPMPIVHKPAGKNHIHIE